MSKNGKFFLPDWVDTEAWEEFVLQREVNLKKPLKTPYSKKLIVNKLDDLRQLGFDPKAVLDQSTRLGWQDVFKIKGQRQEEQDMFSGAEKLLKRKGFQ